MHTLPLPLAMGLMLAGIVMAPARVLEVPPGPAAAISAAVAQADPGDVIQLQSGTYTGTVEISRSGAHDKPIVIAGPAGKDRAVIDGGGTPGKGQQNQAIRITDASWIVIRDIDARNCWTNVIDIRNSSYISVQSCHFLECGQTAVSANGPQTHHVLVENCSWSQDARIYTTWDWEVVHHESLDHYNGGLYGGSDAAGGAVIRSNDVRDVFNGLRWWMSEKAGAEKRYQTNIEIYGNTFSRCRDNCLEPEVFTWNLHIYHNRLNSCPNGAVSIDGVAGGDIFVYGNTGLWNAADQPGPKGGVIPQPAAWAIYKFSNYGTKSPLDSPLFIYHNSWSYGQTYPRGGRARKANDRITQLNNAYLHQSGTMGLTEWPGKDCVFDYDISSQPWTPDVIRLGFEQHGIPNTDPKFIAPAADDFRLLPDSAAIDAGRIVDGFTLWFLGKAPDMGAYENGQPIYGMPFLHRDPPGGALYREKPRIVRVFAQGNRLAVFFSAPLDPATFSREALKITAGGAPVEIADFRFPDAAQTQAVTTTLKEPWPAGAATIGLSFGTAPKGLNGETATLWAADTRIVAIPEGATLTGLMATLLKAD